MSGSVVHEKEVYPQIKHANYCKLIDSFIEWMEAANYSKTSIRHDTRKLNEFFKWMEDHKIMTIAEINNEKMKLFFDYLCKRKNKNKEGGLSLTTLKGYQVTLRKFSRHLNNTGEGHLEVPKRIVAYNSTKITQEIFSQSEVSNIYTACQDDPIGLRDRAMLSVYYGCGLRRNEGIELEIKDVLFSRAMLYVRKGKNYKERYVPMVGRVMVDLKNYIDHGRPILAHKKTGNQLFISCKGNKIQGGAMNDRLKKLKKAAGITKGGAIHTLRHGIATHLLEAGMSLEQIAVFLGHSSLISTQIYTHIVAELNINENES